MRRYRGAIRAERDLFAVLATRRVVFIGFSLTDPDLMEILRVMRGEETGRPRHFALLPLHNPEEESAVRARYRLKFGIEPVFYLPEQSHQNLAIILRLLKQPAPTPEDLPRIGPMVAEFAGLQGRKTPLHPDDPQKGMWGGLSSANGRQISAEVNPVGRRQDWFHIAIKITATNGKPFQGPVHVHVHDTFPKPVYTMDLDEDRLHGVLVLHAYGAFTIGAVCDEGGTTLELDLADLPTAPRAFREN